MAGASNLMAGLAGASLLGLLLWLRSDDDALPAAAPATTSAAKADARPATGEAPVPLPEGVVGSSSQEEGYAFERDACCDDVLSDYDCAALGYLLNSGDATSADLRAAQSVYSQRGASRATNCLDVLASERLAQERESSRVPDWSDSDETSPVPDDDYDWSDVWSEWWEAEDDEDSSSWWPF